MVSTSAIPAGHAEGGGPASRTAGTTLATGSTLGGGGAGAGAGGASTGGAAGTASLPPHERPLAPHTTSERIAGSVVKVARFGARMP